jgi:hypothetical protein
MHPSVSNMRGVQLETSKYRVSCLRADNPKWQRAVDYNMPTRLTLDPTSRGSLPSEADISLRSEGTGQFRLYKKCSKRSTPIHAEK